MANEQRRVARIFKDVGGYYICNDSLDYLDTRGAVFPSKIAALRAAASGPDAYTHATGSGTYWGNEVRSIVRYREGS